MAKTSNLNIRIDPNTKSQVEALYSNFGMTLSDAVNVFFHQSLLYGGLPFELRLPNKETLEVMEDVRNSRNLSGPYRSVDDLLEELHN